MPLRFCGAYPDSFFSHPCGKMCLGKQRAVRLQEEQEKTNSSQTGLVRASGPPGASATTTLIHGPLVSLVDSPTGPSD